MIDANDAQACLIMISSGAMAISAAGTLVYSRVVKAWLDVRTMRAIAAANAAAIAAGRSPPYPEFLPHGESEPHPSSPSLPPGKAP